MIILLTILEVHHLPTTCRSQRLLPLIVRHQKIPSHPESVYLHSLETVISVVQPCRLKTPLLSLHFEARRPIVHQVTTKELYSNIFCGMRLKGWWIWGVGCKFDNFLFSEYDAFLVGFISCSPLLPWQICTFSSFQVVMITAGSSGGY